MVDAAPNPQDARAAQLAARQAEMSLKAKAGETYMQLLQMIFTEKKKIGQDESQLMQHEQDAIRGMTANTRMYALGYGGATGSAVAGLMKVINPNAFRVRHRFWAWVAPSVAWGALQGMQTGARVSTITLLNLPESPFADRLVTHLEKNVPDSPLLKEVPATRKRADWGIDAGPEVQRQAETSGSAQTTEAALGAIGLGRPQGGAVAERQRLGADDDGMAALDDELRTFGGGSSASPSSASRSSSGSVGYSGESTIPDDLTNEQMSWGAAESTAGSRSELAAAEPDTTPNDGGSGSGGGFFGNVYGNTWDGDGDVSVGASDGPAGFGKPTQLSSAPGAEGRAARQAARKAEKERRGKDIATRKRHEQKKN